MCPADLPVATHDDEGAAGDDVAFLEQEFDVFGASTISRDGAS